MKKKSIIVGLGVIIVIVVVFFLFANKNADNKKLTKIGIVQIVDHTSLNTIRTVFIEELKKAGYEDGVNISIDYQNAQNDQSLLKTICQKFVNDKCDLIVAIATPSAQAAISETDSIPILFTACTDPVGSGLVESMEKPGKNVTGTSDYVPIDKTIELSKKITPEIEVIGTIYNPGENVAVAMINDLRTYVDENSIKLEEVTISTSADTQQAVESIIDRVDAILLPIDNTVASSMSLIASIANEKKVPVYVGADSMVQDGGLAGCGVDYTQLAIQTAEMAIDIIEGKNPADMPVQRLEDSYVFLNKSTADAIDVQFSDELLNGATNIFE